jgi:hypothetical protein
MTITDFQLCKAIVIGEPKCNSPVNTFLAAPLANRAVWSAAANGNVIVIGTDEDFHNKNKALAAIVLEDQ